MLPRPTRRSPARALAGRICGVLVLGLVGTIAAGCGGDPGPDAGPDAGADRSPAPSKAPDSGSGQTPGADASTAPALPTATPGSGLAGHLLTGDELAAVLSGDWTTGHTGRAADSGLGPCARYDLVTIGALRAVAAGWRSGAARAAEQVATFPDRTNTQRAAKVLQAWHDRCGERVDSVTAPVDVVVPNGRAHYYTVDDPADGGSFGTVIAGHRIALLWFPGGIEPDRMVRAVRAAASKLR